MRLFLGQNIRKSFKPCLALDWPLLIVTGRSVTHHAFLVEARVGLKYLIPIEMNSLFRLFSNTFFSFFFFSFVSFYLIALILILVESSPKPVLWAVRLGSMSTPFVRHSHLTVRKTLFANYSCYWINQESSYRDYYPNWYPTFFTDFMPFRCFYSNNNYA